MNNIYPDVEIRESNGENHSISFSTAIRIEHEGRWYLNFIYYKYEHPEDLWNNEIKLYYAQRFYKEVYFYQMCGRADINIRDSFGESVFQLDESQITEVERIKLMFA